MLDERNFTWKTYYDKAKHVAETWNISEYKYDLGLAHTCASLDAVMGLKFQGWDGFKTKYRPLFIKWNKSEKFSNSLQKLINLSPVQNMDTTNSIQLTDKQSLTEILNFVYTVRGNMHHGRKDLENKTPTSPRNKDLVEHSFHVLYEILEKTLQNEKLI